MFHTKTHVFIGLPVMIFHDSASALALQWAAAIELSQGTLQSLKSKLKLVGFWLSEPVQTEDLPVRA